jgi:dihydroorotate dehydrogenase
MCERGIGSAVGQNPDVAEIIIGWVMEVATIPVIAKLTPNITAAARAAKRGGANAISLIDTINSIPTWGVRRARALSACRRRGRCCCCGSWAMTRCPWWCRSVGWHNR